MGTQTPAVEGLADTGLHFDVVRTRPARNAVESAELHHIDVQNLLRTIVVRRGTGDR